jgi:undecaprenyl-diphosphatase
MLEEHKHYTDTLLAGVIMAIVFIIWSAMVTLNASFITNFDQAVVKIVANHNPTEIQLFRHLTVIGNTSTIVVITVIIFIVLLWRKRVAAALFLALTMAVTNGFSWCLKHIVQRSRPAVHHLIYADGFSYPSGHSVGSMTLCLILLIFTFLWLKNKTAKTVLTLVWLFIPLFIGYTRMYLHVHFPSDVVGGWLEGITFVLLAYALYTRFYLNRQN